METFKRSDTWKKARTGALRGALLLLWAESWQEKPCGTLPDDGELIALLIDMPLSAFEKNRGVILRGWWKAADGRLYHETITTRVLAMLDKRANDAQRAANRRARKVDSPGSPPEVTAESRVTHGGVQPEFDTKHQAPLNTSEAIASDADGVAKPAKVTDPNEIIFGYGVPMLTATGSTDKHARSFLGGLRKQHGDAAVVDTLRECIKAKPLQPLEWLAAALPPKGSGSSAKPRTKSFRELDAESKRDEVSRWTGGLLGSKESEHDTFDMEAPDGTLTAID